MRLVDLGVVVASVVLGVVKDLFLTVRLHTVICCDPHYYVEIRVLYPLLVGSCLSGR